MKIDDIYKNKGNDRLIQIDSYATHMNDLKNSIVIFRRIEKHNDFEVGSCPSFNGYGTQEEIEKEYELLVPQEELDKYKSWNDVFALIK